MKNVCSVICLIIISMLSPADSFSLEDVKGWQDTQWGMSRTQVLDVIENYDIDDEKISIKSYQIGNYLFNVYFGFGQNNMLNNVYLVTSGHCKLENCEQIYGYIKGLLIKKFGEPIITKKNIVGIIHSWIFTSTQIDLIYDGKTNAFQLSYKEIRGTGDASISPLDKL